ncbi:hypothetical protein DENIS_0773 [Desulfonema ishimotonii]|uniref:Fibronectin type-III domain-containing protein n=1 Tax=Desulfonema ishimotonii TaxID=45657 RepID=A0A401FS85_9BACT|nr:fibronectin type III domain-containing protein [Desulfonema ishimotonii]GBC59832.1 hypothetical protein DENIS_0773 [Desulfonema ishimotonii]
MFNKIGKILGTISLIIGAIGISTAFAESSLTWSPPDSEVVNGYRLYYGTSPGSHPEKTEVGPSDHCALSDLSLKESTTYYFVVRAYNDTGESTDSNEVAWTSGDATPPMPPQAISVE